MVARLAVSHGSSDLAHGFSNSEEGASDILLASSLVCSFAISDSGSDVSGCGTESSGSGRDVGDTLGTSTTTVSDGLVNIISGIAEGSDNAGDVSGAFGSVTSSAVHDSGSNINGSGGESTSSRFDIRLASSGILESAGSGASASGNTGGTTSVSAASVFALVVTVSGSENVRFGTGNGLHDR